MEWPIDRERLLAMGSDSPRYELIARAIEEAITSGSLHSGDRLPTVRQLSLELGVSGTTITAAYNLLSKRGWILSEVGRGTFVNHQQPGRASSRGAGAPARFLAGRPSPLPAPWRQRALTTSAQLLRAAYPAAQDCTTGRPDPALLPLAALRRAWKAAVDQLTAADLQYAGPEPIDTLTQAIVPRLNADGIPAHGHNIVVGSSAQQLIVLTLQVVASLSAEMVVAVEEPGYPAAMDTCERAGYRLVGFEVDGQGAVPESLDTALAGGAMAVLFTPRAHNPTGASWTTERVAELADVLADHPSVVAIEDDHLAGVAGARPGSLLADRRIADRVVYIRSISKSIAPDLRIAVAAAQPRLRSLLAEAKSFADGWSMRLAQRALAYALHDKELDRLLAAAHRAYAARRAAVLQALETRLATPGSGALSHADGVNIWVHLPPGVDSAAVIERAAALGVLVSPGEPFFIRPGRSDVVRLSASAISLELAAQMGEALATAALTAAGPLAAALPI